MTHNERVLALLSDGEPHTHHELYGLHVVAHSRVSDLRKRGHQIEQWRDGDLYVYRLLDSAAEVLTSPRRSIAGGVTAPPAASPQSPRVPAFPSSPQGLAAGAPPQMGLW